MSKKIRWGILGTGDIARQMAEDLRLVEGAELRAVASRTEPRARQFAGTHQIPFHYGSYEALVDDPAIDVVYIATPHVRHCADTLLCIAAGKAVVCEKPLAMNAREAQRMVDAAREAGVFLMEAMWTAFFPAIQWGLGALGDGVIGTPRFVSADFSYAATLGPESRLFNKELGGGALLDIGVYPVALADMVFEIEPERIATTWTRGETGVDVASGIIFDYPASGRAVLSSSLLYDAPQDAVIAGDDGYITFPGRFSQPDSCRIVAKGEVSERIFDREGYGYHYEARDVVECLNRGRTESIWAPLDATLRVMRTLDRIREQWGLRYPNDEATARSRN
ncbi:MAG: oxidoreductase [Candidatus Hydrogenedentota bacterium]